MASEDCLEIFFVRLVLGGNCVWCLVIVFIFMGFREARSKKCGGRFKIINMGGNASRNRGTLFIGKGGSSLLIL